MHADATPSGHDFSSSEREKSPPGTRAPFMHARLASFWRCGPAPREMDAKHAERRRSRGLTNRWAPGGERPLLPLSSWWDRDANDTHGLQRVAAGLTSPPFRAGEVPQISCSRTPHLCTIPSSTCPARSRTISAAAIASLRHEEACPIWGDRAIDTYPIDIYVLSTHTVHSDDHCLLVAPIPRPSAGDTCSAVDTGYGLEATNEVGGLFAAANEARAHLSCRSGQRVGSGRLRKRTANRATLRATGRTHPVWWAIISTGSGRVHHTSHLRPRYPLQGSPSLTATWRPCRPSHVTRAPLLHHHPVQRKHGPPYQLHLLAVSTAPFKFLSGRVDEGVSAVLVVFMPAVPARRYSPRLCGTLPTSPARDDTCLGSAWAEGGTARRGRARRREGDDGAWAEGGQYVVSVPGGRGDDGAWRRGSVWGEMIIKQAHGKLSAGRHTTTVLGVARAVPAEQQYSWNHEETTCSEYILKACQDVIQTWPGVSLNADPLELKPEIFLTWLQSFIEYRDVLAECKRKSEQEADMLASVNVLLEFFAADYRSTIKTIERLTAHGEITFDLLYAILVPRTLIVARRAVTGLERLFQLQSFTRTSVEGVPVYQLALEVVDFVDRPLTQTVAVGRVATCIYIPLLDAYPLRFHAAETQLRETIAHRGQKWVELIDVHHMQYNAIAALKVPGSRLMRHNVKGRIMIDCATSHRLNANYALPTPVPPKNDHNVNGGGNPRDRMPGMPNMAYDMYGEPVLQVPPMPGQAFGDGALVHSQANATTENADLSPEDLLLTPTVVYGFSLLDKLWRSPVAWKANAFASLVLLADCKTLLRSLVEAQGFDDSAKGKGAGLIVNLFGPPGVGQSKSRRRRRTTRPTTRRSSGEIRYSRVAQEEGREGKTWAPAQSPVHLIRARSRTIPASHVSPQRARHPPPPPTSAAAAADGGMGKIVAARALSVEEPRGRLEGLSPGRGSEGGGGGLCGRRGPCDGYGQRRKTWPPLLSLRLQARRLAMDCLVYERRYMDEGMDALLATTALCVRKIHNPSAGHDDAVIVHTTPRLRKRDSCPWAAMDGWKDRTRVRIRGVVDDDACVGRRAPSMMRTLNEAGPAPGCPIAARQSIVAADATSLWRSIRVQRAERCALSLGIPYLASPVWAIIALQRIVVARSPLRAPGAELGKFEAPAATLSELQLLTPVHLNSRGILHDSWQFFAGETCTRDSEGVVK
ncbi:hypothetical protein C8R44DRAFT_740030 [Mycena epipterygia]|nr:hypothetical protein C8R44DRAFT_740030 [Mycena epipterygia]